MSSHQHLSESSTNWFKQHPARTLGVVVIASLVLIIGGLELILARYVSLPSPQSIPEHQTNRYIRLREYRPNSSMMLVPSETRLRISDGLDNAKFPLNIDANGFVKPSIVHEHPDITLVFLGGSTTECAYVSEEKRFPYLAGRLLESQTEKKVNSINAGMRANTSLNSIDGFLNKVIPFSPDVAVFMQNINDIAMLLYERTYWGSQLSDRSPIVEVKYSGKEAPSLRKMLADGLEVFIPNITYALRKITRRQTDVDEFSHIDAEDLIVDDAYKAYMISEFRKNLQTFIGICRARDIMPALMTQASRFQESPEPIIVDNFDHLIQKRNLDLDYQGLRELHELFNQTIREVGKTEDVLVIDLAHQIPQENEFIADAVHLNDVGSELAAEIISQTLLPVITEPGKEEIL